MARRILFGLLLFAFLEGLLSLASHAQIEPNNPCLLTPWVLWYFPDPIPFGFFIAPGQGPVYGQGNYSYYITTWKPPCQPPDPNPYCKECQLHGGQPIGLSTGNTYIEQADLKIPGLGGGLALTRTWSSITPPTLTLLGSGVFGPGWRSTYEERLVMGMDNYIKYVRGSGTYWSFASAAGFTWTVVAPANVSATLKTDTSVNPYFVLTFQNGEQRRFDPTTGKLIAILDRNGNATTVAYDSSGRLATVTDPAGRTLTFSYGSSGNLVTSVSSSVGISLSYSYDGQGRMTQVTKPDLSTLNFSYNTQSLIVSVTDSQGKLLESHTYDSQGRGLTSARANGVEALTVFYPY